MEKCIDFLQNLSKIISERKTLQIILLILCVLAMSASFYNNAFRIAGKNWFARFGKDVESHIPATILAQKYHFDTEGYGLGFVSAKGIKDNYGNGTLRMLETHIPPESFHPYKSAIGIQGFVWAWTYKMLHLENLDVLRMINSLMSALSIVLISILLMKIFGKLFGILFFASMFLSGWVTNFGNNLYWSISVWFLPALFSFYIYICRMKSKIPIILCCIGYSLAICMKSLCSYEYLTSIVLFSLSPFLIVIVFSLITRYKYGKTPPIYSNNYRLIPIKSAYIYTIILFTLSVIGFFLAFTWHIYIRGEGNIWLGLQDVYQHDFLRRMIGGKAEAFDPVYAQSLNANIFTVIGKYLYWEGSFLAGTGKYGFAVLLIVSIALLVQMKNQEEKYLLTSMLFVFALPALSWFILGKAHSFVHTHMNFILWYLGFTAMLLYIPSTFLLQKKNNFKKS